MRSRMPAWLASKALSLSSEAVISARALASVVLTAPDLDWLPCSMNYLLGQTSEEHATSKRRWCVVHLRKGWASSSAVIQRTPRAIFGLLTGADERLAP